MTDVRKSSAHDRSVPSALPRVPGVISLAEIYTLTEARARLGWTEAALRAAKRRGLRLLVCGKRRYITGQEILRFLQSLQSNCLD